MISPKGLDFTNYRLRIERIKADMPDIRTFQNGSKVSDIDRILQSTESRIQTAKSSAEVIQICKEMFRSLGLNVCRDLNDHDRCRVESIATSFLVDAEV